MLKIFATLILILSGTVLMAADNYPRAELLIEPTDLAKAAGEFVVLDARDVANYAELHVKNARWIDQADWSKAFGGGDDVAAWSKRIGDLGIDAKTKVVVYDDNQSKDAARIWWMLRYWGVEDVRLLNGGWMGWARARVGFDAGTPPPPEPKAFSALPIVKRLATKNQLLSAIKANDLQIVDARSEKEFCGDEKLNNKRSGAIPGAKHLEWIDLLDLQTGRFKSADKLTQLFVDHGIDLHRKTATHCQGGGRAAVMAFGLELMGADDVSNYYKSWNEWGNADDTPVVRVEKKK